MRLRLLDRLHEHANRSPDAPAILEVGHDAGRTLSYAQLRSAVDGFTACLQRSNLEPGMTVLLCAPNQLEFVVAFLGVLAAGLKVFPISPDLTPYELTNAAARSAAAAVIGTPAALSAIRSDVPMQFSIESVTTYAAGVAPARCHETSGLLLQSSGTTGRPKIVIRSAASLDAVAGQMVEAIGWRADDRGLAVVPLCHSYGMEHGLLCPIWAGSAVHLCRGFDLRVVRRELTECRITMLPGVPFMFEMLAHHGFDSILGTLRHAYSAGGALPKGVFDAMREKFGVTVSQLYGATEIGSVTFAHPDAEGFDPSSVGRLMRDVDVRVLDVETPRRGDPLGTGRSGQVAVRAASMLSGYVDSDNAEDDDPSMLDGYFLTGDLGTLDEWGNLTITGRLKLLIDIGGLKVNPVEVEEAMTQHPGVQMCVIVPVRVSDTVNRLKAIVTPRDAAAPPAAESLRRFARDRLAAYKVPRVFEVRASLPKSATGKLLRQLVEP